jgi:hypothetical protein
MSTLENNKMTYDEISAAVNAEYYLAKKDGCDAVLGAHHHLSLGGRDPVMMEIAWRNNRNDFEYKHLVTPVGFENKTELNDYQKKYWMDKAERRALENKYEEQFVAGTYVANEYKNEEELWECEKRYWMDKAERGALENKREEQFVADTKESHGVEDYPNLTEKDKLIIKYTMYALEIISNEYPKTTKKENNVMLDLLENTSSENLFAVYCKLDTLRNIGPESRRRAFTELWSKFCTISTLAHLFE